MSSAAAIGPVPRDRRSANRAPGLLELGRQLFEEGDYEDASLALQRRLRLAPHDGEATYMLALSLLRTGDVDRAASMLAASRDAGSADPDVCLEIGEALLPKDPAAAHPWIASAVAARPDDDLAGRRLHEVQAALGGQLRRTGRHRADQHGWWYRLVHH